MSEEAKETETDVSADDWAAALAEQEAVAPVDGDAEDPWAAALAEQEAAGGEDAAEATVRKARIFQNLVPDGGPPAANNLDMILDIPVQINVELGRTKIAIRNLLQLAQGSVVELDGLAGEPMNVLVNGCLIAQGEVVVVNDKFGIRLTDIITPAERLRRLNK
ncbi:MAG TPA: flagellar motor switch protein FliN [Thiobacillaceae bacterium]|nr:flagellar motor switch protein FliN [Thiobacillaceae bacterium]HNU64440.1 flagellar motor switch protein FliN [Thiobacillaceae bacterium]